MALAIDGSTPAVVVNTSATTAAITTASFTPPAGAVLLVLWVGDEASGPSAPTITDSLGSPLTYTQTDWKRKADAAPNVFGQASAWTAVVGSSAAMTVTVTSGAASGERVSALSVQVLTGADTSTPVGAHGKSGSTSAATIAQTYTAQASGGQGFIAVGDPAVTGAETAGAGTTVIGSGNILTNISYALARRTAADDSNGASNSINLTLGSTSTDLAWVYVEIKPAGGAPAATWQPSVPTRRRPTLRPFRAHTSTPVRAQADPPIVLSFADPARRVRGLLQHRAHTVQPVPAQIVVTPPAYPPANVRTRLRGLRLFRPRAAVPVPAQVVVTPSAYPPPNVRTRLRGLRLFRPHVASPVPAQVTFVAADYPPQSVRTRLKGLRIFRGHAVAPVPAQVAVVPAAYVPRPVRGQLKFLAYRRHGTVQPLTDQSPPPQLEARPRPKLRPVRSHIVTPLQEQPAVPLFARIRVRLAKVFRGDTRMAAPPQIILIAPPRVAQATKARRSQFAARRHRGGVDGWMVPGVHLCTTPRPNTGTTGHVVTLTARPDTGITQDPC